jgi:glutamate dehydrogenase/leucine dehydrogenase
VCGSANNQLAEPADAERLACRGVLYAPDYVVNAGGIINIAEERTPEGYDRARALERVAAIEHTTAEVLAAADAEGVTTAEAADRLARRRLEAAPWPGIRSFPTTEEGRP